MSRLRTAGALLLLAGLLSYLGQFLAAYLWQGIFSLEYNVISDLGTTECRQVGDVFAVRFVCSPGHAWFSGGLVLGGLALLLGGVLAARSVTDTLGRTLLGAKPLGSALSVAGLGMILGGAIAYNVQGVVHLLGLALLVIGVWTAMGLSVWSTVSLRRRIGDTVDRATVLSKTMLPLTALLLVVSAVGVVLILVSPLTATFGLFFRIAVDPVLLWLITVGAALVMEGSPRRRQAREADRRDRRDEQAARDAALRKAAGQ